MPEPNWFEDYLNSLRRKGEFAKEFPFLQPPPEAVSDVRTAPFKLPKPMTIAEAGLEETPFRPEAERKIRQTLGIAELPPTEPRKTVEELLGREPYQPRVVGGYELPRWQQELSDMAAVALGIQGVGIPAAQQSWRALTNLALTRQVSRLESGQGRPITKEQAQYFANQLRGEAQKRGFQWDLDKQSLRDLFKSTRGRTVPTLEATQRAEETAQQAVNRFAPAIIPKGTQTGALAFGGRTPTPESVAAKIAQGQALSKAEEQLKGNNPQAVQTALNQLKGIQTPLPPVLSEVAREAPTGRFAVTLRNIGDILSPEENFTQKGNLKPQARTQLIKDVVEAVDNGVLGIEEAGTLLNEYINHPLLNKGDYEGFLAYWRGRPQALITTKPSAPMTEGELATFLQAPKPVTPTAPAAPAVTKLSPTITITHITSAKGGEFVLKPIKITNDESGLFLEPDKITFAGIAVKPSGGLWTAPGNTWEEYLKSRGKELSERWKDTTAKVTFEVETKNVVVIDSIDDAKNKLPWKKGIRHPVVDFTALKKGGATGVYLTRKGEAQTRRHPKYPLMGWDIESLLILDEKIVTVKSIEKAGEPPGTIVKVTKPIIKVASSPTFTAKRKAALQDIVDATKIERISPGHPKYQEVVDDGGASYDIPTHTVFITTTPRPPPKIVFHEVAHDLWEQDRAPKAVIKTFISEFNKWQETPQGLKATAPHKRMTKEYGVVAFTKDNAELFAEVFKRVAMGIPHNQFPKTNAAIYKWLDTPGAAKSVTTAAIPEVEAGPTQALTTVLPGAKPDALISRVSLEEFVSDLSKKAGVPVEFVDRPWRTSTFSIRYKQPYLEIGTKNLPKGVDPDNFKKIIALHELGHRLGVNRKASPESEKEAWDYVVAQAGKYDVDLGDITKLLKTLHPEYGPGAIMSQYIKPVVSLKIVRAHNTKGGATFTVTGENLVGQDVYAIGAYPERSVNLPKAKITKAEIEAFVFKNSDLLKQPRHTIGTWFDRDTGESILDISVTRDNIESAMELAQQQGQKAIFNLKSAETITVPEVTKLIQEGADIGAPPVKPPQKPPVTTGGEENLPPPEQDPERLTPEQVEETFALMKSILGDPKTKEFTNSIKILQKEELSRRARNLEPRINELLAEGVPAEEAMRQATKEVMSGELVKSPTVIGQRFTQLMRDALFARIKEKLAGEPFEILSTNDALTNFLVTGKVPDVPGIAGGSARTRLERVFGDQPEIMKFIDREKPLADIVKEIFYKIEPPTPLDQKSVEYLRSLSDIPRIDENGQIVALDKQLTSFGLPSMLNSPYEQLVTNDPRSAAEQLYGLEKLLLGTALAEGKISKTTYDIELSIARDKMAPLPDTTQYEPPIQKAIRQPSLIPELEQHRLVSVLKELAWLPNDIAQLVRATKASVDNSWGRQAHITAVRHPRSFMRNQILGIQAMFSQEVADAAWLRLTRSPNYAIYEKYGPPRGFDMYRMPAELVGKDITLGAEEFGYLNKERLLPRITANLPWIKFSARGFNTAINGYTSDLFDMGVAQFQKNQLRVASGEIKLKPLQSYDVGSKISDLIAFLSEAHGRGSLRYNILGSQVDLKGVAPVLNSAFFALRNNLAQFMLPRHLFNFRNPEIARMAWENIFTYIALVGGIVTLGKLTGVWDTDDDPTSADYGNILLFDGKVHIDPWMGRKQWVVFISRLARGTGISAESGVKYQVDPISTTTSFMRFRSAPGTSFILDVATGKTAVGEKLNLKNPKQWAERVSPFSMWDIYEAWYTVGALGGVMATPLAIQGVGVQAYGFGWKKDFASYNLIPTDPNERESKGTMSRTEYRVKRPDIDAKLFIIGEVTSLQTEAAANYVIKFALANKVDLRTIPEVDRRIAEINKRVDLGLPAKLENTPTDALVRYILSGQLQSNPQPKAPTPQPSVPQPFSSEDVLKRLFGK